jgi:hypothetical protein
MLHIWGEKRGVYRVLVGKPEGGDQLQDTRLGGSIMLKWIFEKCDESMDWMDVAQDMDRWRAYVHLPVQ